MTTTTNKLASILLAIIASVVTLLVSFWAFRWVFIQLWEWQHAGRRMMFVIDPEIKAALVAILFSIVAFFIVHRRSSRPRKP